MTFVICSFAKAWNRIAHATESHEKYFNDEWAKLTTCQPYLRVALIFSPTSTERWEQGGHLVREKQKTIDIAAGSEEPAESFTNRLLTYKPY